MSRGLDGVISRRRRGRAETRVDIWAGLVPDVLVGVIGAGCRIELGLLLAVELASLHVVVSTDMTLESRFAFGGNG